MMFCTNCGVALYEGAASCSACGRAVSDGTPQMAAGKVAYAGFWLRLLASIIDELVLVIPSMAVVIFAVAFLGLEMPPPDAPMTQLPPMRVFIPMEVIIQVVHWIYYALMESSIWQGTLGKRALGLGVTDIHGKRISLGRASGRALAKLLSSLTFMLGYVMAGFTEKKQALHDIISDCLVVKMP
jgi:uncharacterized RDD family membrane protein YckC